MLEAALLAAVSSPKKVEGPSKKKLGIVFLKRPSKDSVAAGPFSPRENCCPFTDNGCFPLATPSEQYKDIGPVHRSIDSLLPDLVEKLELIIPANWRSRVVP